MYGRLHQRKLKQNDYIMSCQKARRELDLYIDQQAKRVNIDSAKKRAVLQHMDYDGFRQMVLGANIFPTKTTELQKFTKGEGGELVKNKVSAQSNGGVGQEADKQVEKLDVSQVITQVHGKSQLLCNSFRQFKKKFLQHYPKPNQQQLTPTSAQTLYILIKNQDNLRISKIFNMQCQANILVKVVELFQFVIQYLRENDSKGKVVMEVVFQVKFLETVLKLKSMREFGLVVLSKKERARVVEFLVKAKGVMSGQCDHKEGENNQVNVKEVEQKENNEGSENKPSSTKTSINEDENSIDELIAILSKK